MKTELIFCEKLGSIERTLEAGEKLELFLLAHQKDDMELDCLVNLVGVGAEVKIYLILLTGGAQKIKINCKVVMSGEKTRAEIVARSIVAGSSEKSLTSSLDFVSGAGGACGHEEERVLLLGDKAVSESTPIILCGESQVEGSHALSSGNINESALFYLMTRGFDRLSASKVLARAAVADVVELLPEEKERAEIFRRVDELLEIKND